MPPSPLLLPHFESFSFSRHLCPPVDLPLSLSFGGRYYVIVRGIGTQEQRQQRPDELLMGISA